MSMVLLVGLLAFIVSIVLSYVLIHYANSAQLLDHPNERSSHHLPTPRGGGLAIVLVSIFGLLAYLIFESAISSTWSGLMVSMLLVSVISFIDDHRHVRARSRFTVHLLASVIGIQWFAGMPPMLIVGLLIDSNWLLLPLYAFLLVWVLNLFNFMDGTDGIASVEALFVSLAMFLLSGQLHEGNTAFVAFEALIFGSVAGFLFWNWPSAKIFMGDVGSSFLGFVLAALGLYAVNHGWMNLWTVLILFGVFFVDATFTLIRRMLRGDRWYEAHRSHAYQKISRMLIQRYLPNMDASIARQQSHRMLCYGVSLINFLWLLPLAWLSIRYGKFAFPLMILAFAPLVLIAWKSAAGVSDDAI